MNLTRIGERPIKISDWRTKKRPAQGGASWVQRMAAASYKFMPLAGNNLPKSASSRPALDLGYQVRLSPGRIVAEVLERRDRHI